MEPTPQEASEPQYLGEYEVLKSIGKGKFAVVYRARKIGSEQIVALKRISVDMMDEKSREKTLKEVRLLSSLDHPNIIRYIDSFIIKNDLLIIYEWAAAGDLKRQLRKAQERGVGFEERIVWKYFSQICDAMQHMHDKRIMHRDLKPANIFLTLDGTIKVGDLGLSRELSEHTIQAHSKVGTPLYMSPEVLKGEDGYDFKSDIWSLGCLLYELAMLKSPFKSEGLNMYSLFQKISAGDFQPLPDTYSETLRTLAYSMISTRPEDRPVIAQVCEVARRMRAETTEKHLRQRKAAGNSNGSSDNGNKINAEVAVVPSEAPSADNKDDKDASGHLRPISGRASGSAVPTVDRVGDVDEYDFDTKPTTAARSSKERVVSAGARSRPSSGGAGVEASKPSSAISHSRFRRDDDDEQTADWKTVGGKREENTDGGNRGRESHSLVVGGHDNNTSNPVAEVGRNDRSSFVGADDKVNGMPRGAGGPPSRQAVERPVAASSAPAVAYKRPKSGATTSRPPSHRSRPSSGADGRGSAAAVSVDSTFHEHFAQSSAAFALMESLHGMLVLLGYSAGDDGFDNDEDDEDGGLSPDPPGSRGSTSRQLLPFHFACDLQVFSSVAGQRPGTQFLQFRRMVCVAVWLVKQSFVVAAMDVVARMDRRLDTPLTLAKQLVRAAQVLEENLPSTTGGCVALGVSAEEVRQMNATSLLPGHGVHVCALLCYLAGQALRAQQFEPPPLVYASGADAAVPDDSSLAVDEEAVHDDVAGDYREMPDDEDWGGSGGGEDVAHALSTSGQLALSSVLAAPDIDPAVWRAETERVARRLDAGHGSAWARAGGEDWSQHLEALRSYRESASGRGAGGRGVAHEWEDLTPAVGVLRRTVHSGLAQVAAAEKVLCASPAVSEAASRYAHHKQALSGLETRLASTVSRIAEAGARQSAAEEIAAEAEDLLQAALGRHGGEDGPSGNSAVVRLREAAKQIRTEIRGMDVSIALLSARLLAVRISTQRDSARSALQARKSRHNKKAESNDSSVLDD